MGDLVSIAARPACWGRGSVDVSEVDSPARCGACSRRGRAIEARASVPRPEADGSGPGGLRVSGCQWPVARPRWVYKLCQGRLTGRPRTLRGNGRTCAKGRDAAKKLKTP